MKFLFLTGPHAVGKSYFMDELSSKTSFFTFDTGPHMRKLHKENAPELKIGEWVDELEKKYGPYITCDMLCKEFDKEYDGNDNVIITGFRQIEGIEYMINYYQPEAYEILYVDADFHLLKSNFECREKTKVTEEDFSKYLQTEQDWGLKYLKQLAIKNTENFIYYKKNTNQDNIPVYIFENPQKNKQFTLRKNNKK